MGGINSKTLIKLFDRFMNRKVGFWNDKEITTTAPVTVRTVIGRKILRKTSVKTCKLCSFKNCAIFNRKSMHFLRTEATLVYLLMFDTILAALF